MSRRLNRLYHASPVQGLTEISPHISTHGQKWVYAADDLAVAAAFLSRLGGDFTCASGVYQGTHYLCERFEGAFDRRYGSVRGSIYVLPGDKFLAGQTSYSEDFVCLEPVKPLHEFRVDNAKDYLIQLASTSKLIIKFYPERFCIAEDDADLVEKALRMCHQSGEEVLEQMRGFHPQLLGQVMKAIEEQR